MKARQQRRHRILMTADAVGGVWSYALRLVEAFGSRTEVLLAVTGPPPSRAQRAGAARIPQLRLVVGDFDLEWTLGAERSLDAAGDWLRVQAAAFRPDIVHVNGYAAAAERWSVPVLVVAHSCVLSWWSAVHGTPAPPEWSSYGTRVIRGLAAAHRVIAPTHAMLQALHRHYGDLGDRCRVIANGYKTPALATHRKEKIVLAAGRFWDEAKNLATLDGAAARVSWPVLVAGDCHHPDGRVVLPRHATSLGIVEQPALAEWMGRAAVFAAPARYEPFGLSILEAAAAGCALVLGDIPSLRELWHGAAIFVPPAHDAALANAIDWLMRNDAERDTFGRAARARSERYSPDAMANDYLNVYDEMSREAQTRQNIAQVG